MPVLLLVTADLGLAQKVKSAATSLPQCEIRWVQNLARLDDVLPDGSVRLVIVHASADSSGPTLHAHLQRLCALAPRVATLVVRDELDGESDVRCLRMGVKECLTRPLDLGRLHYLIDNLTLRSRLAGERAARVVPESATSAVSPAMQNLMQRAQRIAARDVSVMLNGETGVGKTHLARWVHNASPRAARPFVSVNCGSLPANLIESELFGHKRGAFTGADGERVGKFAYVEDGTLLLDEIDALPLSAQAKLLRVLDEGLFERIGCNTSLQFRGRLIAASNRSLEELIERDEFRADLYYRLNIVQFEIPPLRQRMEEVRPLVRSFLDALARKHRVAVPGVDQRVWPMLEGYGWPGNLRELRNAIEHAITHCDGLTIRPEDLPDRLSGPRAMAERALSVSNGRLLGPSSGPQLNALAQARQEGEYRRILDALDLCGNNRSRAAQALGISRAALYKKLASFGITRAFPDSA
jgi:DNA-binding NtrC family response regulator